MQHRFVLGRIERVAYLAEGDQAKFGQQRVELVRDRLERAGEVAWLRARSMSSSSGTNATITSPTAFSRTDNRSRSTRLR
jgi:hypothetical protein